MKVEPIQTYPWPKYPCMGEEIQSTNMPRFYRKSIAFLSAMLAVSSTLTGCDASFGATAGAPTMPSNYTAETSFVETMGAMPVELNYLSEQEVFKSFNMKPRN